MMKDSDGKKTYCKGRVVNWAMELGTVTFDLLLSMVSSEVNWSSNQNGTIWFFDKTLCEEVMLVDDVQFQNMFEMYKSEMHCQVLVVVKDKTVWEQPICVLPANINPALKPATYTELQLDLLLPDLGMQPGPRMQPEPTDPEPQPHLTMPNKSQCDIFDNEEEYVGINDEHMYITIPPAQPSLNAQTDSPMPTNYATNENVAAEIVTEVEVTDVDPDEISVLHDPENPRIEKGSLFPDIITLRKAVRHYAVKTGFELAPGIKTDPTRYIARCKHPGCPWRIHASRIHDNKTIQV